MMVLWPHTEMRRYRGDTKEKLHGKHDRMAT
jgi:hypothetical protein